jgi:hypothetical protein
MKKIILLAAGFCFTIASFAQNEGVKLPASPDDFIQVKVQTHDFGKIKQGVPVEHYFVITNISKSPVVVENTYADCGCTTPEKILEPILPGASVKLKVNYNAAAVGNFTKNVNVKLAGVDQPKQMHITGEVLTVEEFEKLPKTAVKDTKTETKETPKETKTTTKETPKTAPKIQKAPTSNN